MISSPEALAVSLHDRGSIKFAPSEEEFWTLKSGRKSPVYVNLRGITSFSTGIGSSSEPEVRELVVSSYVELLGQREEAYDHILGIPHAMTCLAGMVAYVKGDSILSMRTDSKSYGAHKTIEGDYSPGDLIVALDDVVTDGTSKFETVEAVKAEGLVLNDFVVLVDREEGGKEALHQKGLNLSAAIGLGGLTYVLAEQGEISRRQVAWMEEYYQGLVETSVISDIPESLYVGPSS
ncbi:MAG: hypothetical protein WD887_01880 [Candidatus Saccharimonadales bacterium]